MNDKQIDEMVLEIIKIADYDLWKSLDIGNSELDPEEIEDTMVHIRRVVKEHIEKGKKDE